MAVISVVIISPNNTAETEVPMAQYAGILRSYNFKLKLAYEPLEYEKEEFSVKSLSKFLPISNAKLPGAEHWCYFDKVLKP